jgi:hypothetical protein
MEVVALVAQLPWLVFLLGAQKHNPEKNSEMSGALAIGGHQLMTNNQQSTDSRWKQ